jgi:cation transport protein ChaC
MWVFGYGSLMADGWEVTHGCLRRCHATLPGFSRSFDKASSESRGTPKNPAPTLRLVPSQGACSGIAFEFMDERRVAVLKDLLEREGKTFFLREKSVRLDTGESIAALVPMYEGRHIILNKTISEIAAMAIRANGKRGSGVQYIEDVASHLQRCGVQDPVVDELLNEVLVQLRRTSG